MDLAIPGPDLNLDHNPGPALIEARGGITPAHVPTPTGAVPGAGPAAGNTVGAATAALPCPIVADTLETGQTQTPTTAWVYLD